MTSLIYYTWDCSTDREVSNWSICFGHAIATISTISNGFTLMTCNFQTLKHMKKCNTQIWQTTHRGTHMQTIPIYTRKESLLILYYVIMVFIMSFNLNCIRKLGTVKRNVFFYLFICYVILLSGQEWHPIATGGQTMYSGYTWRPVPQTAA